MKSKFLLLLGASGVGKSTIIRKLQSLDSRFIYIKPYTNRPLRDTETEKKYKTQNELDLLIAKGNILFINEIYGFIYATPKSTIYGALSQNNFPLLDFPVHRLLEMKNLFRERMYSVYILPPNIEELSYRLNDGRDPDGVRLKFALNEIESVRKNIYSGFNFIIVNHNDKLDETTSEIYNRFITSIYL